MNKFLILSILFFTNTFSITSQNNLYTKDDFCKTKWIIKSIEYNQNVIEYTEAQQKNNWMIFRENGKHEVTINGEITQDATWKYDESNNNFTFKDKGKTTYQKIIKLTKDKLVLEGELEGKKLTFYLEKNE